MQTAVLITKIYTAAEVPKSLTQYNSINLL